MTTESPWSLMIADLKRELYPRISAVGHRAADHFGPFQRLRILRAYEIVQDLGADYGMAFLDELAVEIQNMEPEHRAALQLMMTGRPEQPGSTEGKP